jgi:Ran GTPase-activating protein (RanGAP) involved in mRNA processing and transport
MEVNMSKLFFQLLLRGAILCIISLHTISSVVAMDAVRRDAEHKEAVHIVQVAFQEAETKVQNALATTCQLLDEARAEAVAARAELDAMSANQRKLWQHILWKAIQSVAPAGLSKNGLLESTTLNLSGTKLTNAFVGDFKEALDVIGGWSALQTLTLLGCSIEDEVASLLFETAFSGKMPALLTLNVRQNNIKDGSMRVLARTIASATPIALRELILYNNTNIGREGIIALSNALSSGNMSSLKTLWVGATAMGADGAAALARPLSAGKVSSLVTLEIGHNSLGAQGVESLAQAMLSGNLSELEALDLSGNNMKDAGAVSIGRVLESGCVSKLKALNMYANSIRDEGACAVARGLNAGKVPNLETLRIWNNEITGVGMSTLVEVLGNTPVLTNFDVSHNKLGNEGMELFSQAVIAGRPLSLKMLDARSTGITDAGAGSLARALTSGKLPNLTTLIITGNPAVQGFENNNRIGGDGHGALKAAGFEEKEKFDMAPGRCTAWVKQESLEFKQ